MPLGIVAGSLQQMKRWTT